jgi:dipeptidyl aminopeptidase/acylaminoacyl peptidase
MASSRGISVFVVLHAAVSLASAQSADPGGPLKVSDVLSVKEFSDRVQIDLSPDARFVAFALRDPMRRASMQGGMRRYFSTSGVPASLEGSDIYVTEVLTSQTRNITQPIRSSNWSPSWSPDGRTLAFFSDRDGLARLWLWTRSTRQFRRLSPDLARSYFGFEGIRWAPGGRRIAVKLSPLNIPRSQLDRLLPLEVVAAPPRSGTVTATVFTSEARDRVADSGVVNLDSTRSFLNTELSDLAMIDVATGRVRRLALRARVIGWHWSPDGRSLAYTTRQPDGGAGHLVYDRYDLFVVDTAGGPPRLVAPRLVQEYGQNFSWSPDGSRLAYVSDGQLHVVAREGGESRRLGIADRSFARDYRAPLWTNDESLLLISGDTLFRVAVASGETVPVAVPQGHRLLEIVAPGDAQHVSNARVTIATQDPATKLSGFRTVDFANGIFSSRLDDLFAFGVDLPYHVDVSRDGETIAYVAERGDRPPEVWITQQDLAHTNRITNLNPQVTRLALGATRLLQWSGPRGTVLRGALLMPGNYEPGKRFPLVVKVYGGATLSSRMNRFGLEGGIDNLHLLSTRGYGVLLPDAPLREGSPLEDLAAAVLPGVDSAIALGLADPERLALMGHSYGGYSALALLVQTDRFKAAVSSGGFSNLFTQYGVLRDDGSAIGVGMLEGVVGRMGGHPWELRDRYIANSPYFFFDRVTTPVLLVHGGADRTVPVAAADETFVALRRLGKTVEYARYEGEEHHPGSWSVANATDYWERIFAWLEKYLK